MRYQISQTAYVKLVLHAIKHRSAAVNGILIGKAGASSGGGGGGEVEEESAGSVSIVDCVPLFHGQLGLLPMLELALTQIEEYFSSHQDGGLTIVGCYHANERFDDTELSGIPKKLGDHIARYFSSACILLLDNKLLESVSKGGKKPALQLFTRDSSRGWRASGDLTLKESTANDILYDYILEGRERGVADFDDHLDDITKDWLNPSLFD